MNCGIIGLPNVGKSTIFSALSSSPAEAANYPFCTISPNIGIVEVPDKRLDQIHKLIQADKRVPAVTEFVDIAGLVRGASKGEGLGNQFLANIREVGVIAHVLRCFEDQDIVHVDGRIDPVSDIETVDTELALADLQTIERRLEKTSRALKVSDPKQRAHAAEITKLYQRVAEGLGQGIAIRSMELTDEEESELQPLSLLTHKTQILVCNISENQLKEDSEHVQSVKRYAEKTHAEVILLCGKLEADIASLDDPEEKSQFLKESGLEESGLSRLIRTAYSALGMSTFYTAGGIENRAWTFRSGSSAPQCAGLIHSDFERGFIKADVYHCTDLFELGNESSLKSAGKLRLEGKEYKVQDGDVIHFRFNTG